MHDAAKEAAVLLYSPGTDTFQKDMIGNVDRVFYFDEGQDYYEAELGVYEKFIRSTLPSLSFDHSQVQPLARSTLLAMTFT